MCFFLFVKFILCFFPRPFLHPFHQPYQFIRIVHLSTHKIVFLPFIQTLRQRAKKRTKKGEMHLQIFIFFSLQQIRINHFYSKLFNYNVNKNEKKNSHRCNVYSKFKLYRNMQSIISPPFCFIFYLLSYILPIHTHIYTHPHLQHLANHCVLQIYIFLYGNVTYNLYFNCDLLKKKKVFFYLSHFDG